jgi:acetyl esterase/lipase
VFNVVPRDGGNTFNGLFVFSGANGSMQSSNYTDSLKAAGLRSPSELIKVYEINPMGGGRIVRDKLWFYLTYREVVAENTVPGMFFNRNAGNPNAWIVDFDTSRPAFVDSVTRNGVARLTWQVSPRNKISLSHSEQYDRQNKTGGGSATRTPEAQGMRLYTPGHIQQATWTAPFTNRLMFEAGWGDYLSRYANFAPRGLYEGGNGPVSRERARIIRALLYPRPKLPTGALKRFDIPGPNGPILVETVRPFEGEPIGTLVYYHGGGFIIGDIDSHQAHAIRLANRARVVVINVDYRLAPEYPFPRGIDDAIAAAQWANANLDRLGGAGQPLAVGGDSSGGNFAAVTAIVCRDAGIKLAAQLLLYPLTDHTGPGNPDIRKAYFGDGFEKNCRPWRARAGADQKGVAPAIIGRPARFSVPGQHGLCRGVAAAGVPLVLRQYPTLNHGFFGYTGISKAREAADELSRLRRCP